jgi:hypothetical protein
MFEPLKVIDIKLNYQYQILVIFFLEIIDVIHHEKYVCNIQLHQCGEIFLYMIGMILVDGHFGDNQVHLNEH